MPERDYKCPIPDLEFKRLIEEARKETQKWPEWKRKQEIERSPYGPKTEPHTRL